jgi:hypothetical protein
MKGIIKNKIPLILLSAILFTALTILTGGCATPKIKPINKKDLSTHIQFLINGTTTREDVLLRLGEPSGRFEGDRILTYILSINDKKELQILPRQLVASRNDPRVYELNPMVCSLVLVFKNDNLLEKSELICSGDELK